MNNLEIAKSYSLPLVVVRQACMSASDLHSKQSHYQQDWRARWSGDGFLSSLGFPSSSWSCPGSPSICTKGSLSSGTATLYGWESFRPCQARLDETTGSGSSALQLVQHTLVGLFSSPSSLAHSPRHRKLHYPAPPGCKTISCTILIKRSSKGSWGSGSSSHLEDWGILHQESLMCQLLLFSSSRTHNGTNQSAALFPQRLHTNGWRWQQEGWSWDANCKSQSHSKEEDLGEKDELEPRNPS